MAPASSVIVQLNSPHESQVHIVRSTAGSDFVVPTIFRWFFKKDIRLE